MVNNIVVRKNKNFFRTDEFFRGKSMMLYIISAYFSYLCTTKPKNLLLLIDDVQKDLSDRCCHGWQYNDDGTDLSHQL